MSTEIQSSIRTLGEVLSAMAPFAGGSIPNTDTQEYEDWVNWIGQKQEEYARRGFWRRCLTREVITLTEDDETHVLPTRFHKPNGLFALVVNGVDWQENPNSDDQHIFIEMINDPDDDDFGKWQMRFSTAIKETDDTVVLWYFSNPPKPAASADILLLPGDMVAYGALQEYFRTTGSEGSEDKAEEMAENRFSEYLSLETLPDKSELIVNSENITHVDYLANARARYATRTNRNNQY